MNAIINVLKPPGMSSSGVVVFLKRILKEGRVGHAGTLDPDAAGVLVVTTGRATRLSDILMDEGKEYIAEITFGAETDTQDASGNVIRTSDVKVSKSELLRALACFEGKITQIAPKYSAVKIGGQASYKLVRKGKEVPDRVRTATINEIEMVCQIKPDSYLLRICCSKGTYIRTLIKDIGISCGSAAVMTFLLRTRSGGFWVENAYTPDEIKTMVEAGDHSFLIRPEDALRFECINVDENTAQRMKNGVPISLAFTDTYAKIYFEEEFLGLAAHCECGERLKIHLGEI